MKICRYVYSRVQGLGYERDLGNAFVVISVVAAIFLAELNPLGPTTGAGIYWVLGQIDGSYLQAPWFLLLLLPLIVLF